MVDGLVVVHVCQCFHNLAHAEGVCTDLIKGQSLEYIAEIKLVEIGVFCIIGYGLLAELGPALSVLLFQHEGEAVAGLPLAAFQDLDTADGDVTRIHGIGSVGVYEADACCAVCSDGYCLGCITLHSKAVQGCHFLGYLYYRSFFKTFDAKGCTGLD